MNRQKMFSALGNNENELKECLYKSNRLLTYETVESCSEALYQYIQIAKIPLDEPLVREFLVFCKEEQFDFIKQ